MRGKIRQLIKRILYECMQDADLKKMTRSGAYFTVRFFSQIINLD